MHVADQLDLLLAALNEKNARAMDAIRLPTWTVKRLRELAKARRLRGTSRLRKAELVKRLQASLDDERRAWPVLPEEIRLERAPRQKKKPAKPAPAPDYIDRLQKPWADRLAYVQVVERRDGITFLDQLVIGLILAHPTKVPGHGEYASILGRFHDGLTVAEAAALDGYRRAVLEAVEREAFAQVEVVAVLEQLDGARLGTVRIDELPRLVMAAYRKVA